MPREKLVTSNGVREVYRTSRIFRIDFIDDDTLKVKYSIEKVLDNIEAYRLGLALIATGEYIEVFNIIDETYLDVLADLYDYD